MGIFQTLKGSLLCSSWSYLVKFQTHLRPNCCPCYLQTWRISDQSASVFTTFQINFSDAKGQLTPKSVVVYGFLSVRWLWRYSCLKLWTHTHTDKTSAQWVYYKLTLWAFGSGELKRTRLINSSKWMCVKNLKIMDRYENDEWFQNLISSKILI